MKALIIIGVFLSFLVVFPQTNLAEVDFVEEPVYVFSEIQHSKALHGSPEKQFATYILPQKIKELYNNGFIVTGGKSTDCEQQGTKGTVTTYSCTADLFIQEVEGVKRKINVEGVKRVP